MYQFHDEPYLLAMYNWLREKGSRQCVHDGFLQHRPQATQQPGERHITHHLVQCHSVITVYSPLQSSQSGMILR